MSVVDMDLYTADIPYLIGTYIREYDISKANINVLYSKKKISKQQYEFLYSCPKLQREILVGKMRKEDPDLTQVLKEGIRKARNQLYLQNQLTEENILSVKNDAVFVIDRDLRQTQFGTIRFVKKNTYTSFYKIYSMEFYYSSLEQEILDVKGMGDSLQYHEQYFGDLLKFLFYEAERETPIKYIKTLSTCIRNYTELKYSFPYYREFNNRSKYKSKIQLAGEQYYFSALPNGYDPIGLDISYNFGILMSLYTYATERQRRSRSPYGLREFFCFLCLIRVFDNIWNC